MVPKLAGTLIIYNGIIHDYCYIEAIKNLQSFCDFTIVVDCGSTDGTAESLKDIDNENTLVMYRDKREWDLIKGREKLSYYTNIAIDKAAELGYEWQFNLQGDEILHQDCFPHVKTAISIPDVDGYWSKRINLWGNSQHELNVGYDRIPVGTEIIRLTKTKYHSVGDAQSIDYQQSSWAFLDLIRIYHMGFVRNKYVHTKKIKHMLEDIFQMGMDTRIEKMGEVFDCWGCGFAKEDIIPIHESLPDIIQVWAAERDMINQVEI